MPEAVAANRHALKIRRAFVSDKPEPALVVLVVLCYEGKFVTFCLLHSGHVSSLTPALALAAMAIFANGFHKVGTVVNAASDLAPKHSGSVFGLINTAASASGSSDSGGGSIFALFVLLEVNISYPRFHRSLHGRLHPGRDRQLDRRV
jgi:hypothetical protein